MTDLPINQVVTGDCREVMAEWPSDCIDFVMFSPPFWGLRDYGEEAESVWDEDENCDHVWDSNEVHHDNLRFRDPNDTAEVGNNGNPEVYSESDRRQEFCSRCGAWCGQLGLEPDYRMYVQHLVEVGREIKRILKPSGSWYLNLGDTYSTHLSGGEEYSHNFRKPSVDNKGARMEWKKKTDLSEKCKMLMPYRVALALIDDGWICRNDIIWLKPNPMPSSVKDRLNTTTERIFHFVKNKQYYYDLDAIREPHKEESVERNKYPYNSAGFQSTKCPREDREEDVVVGNGEGLHPKGKNPGDVIEQTTEPFPEAHFAVYPPKLCEKPIKSSCPPKVCPECGKPYERTTEIIENENAKIPERWGANLKGEYHGMGKEDEKGKAQAPSNLKRNIIEGQKKKVEFKGWKKTCNCSAAKTKPGIVLDPMCGAGSTLVKAKQLGRRYIGIEISEEYADITRERLRKGDEEYKRWKRKERKLKREAERTANLEEFV